MTVIVAVSPALLNGGRGDRDDVLEALDLVGELVDARPWRRRCPGRRTTTISGPLKPGPKPSDSRSYALRWVVDVGCEPSSGRPSSSG